MSNSQNPVILRFDNVSFSYNDGKKAILDSADFSIRQNTKITIMWPNGAGKSTVFKMITGEIAPIWWKINISQDISIAISKQVVPRELLDLTIKEYFQSAFDEIDYQLDKKIHDVLETVHFTAPRDKQIKDYSGWQQARLLLAYALIQKPDILLLDEPTNNLDAEWIWNLIWFLLWYEKTIVVISHDADFLNMFTDWVLYVNIVNHTVEQYRWDYYDVVEQIAAQVEKEKSLNARLEKEILDKKEKINYFANKWWKMRNIASKMRDEVLDAEDSKVSVRRDDKTISHFAIEFENYIWPLISISSIDLMNSAHTIITKKIDLIIKKWNRYLFTWPNGIGKSTLFKQLIDWKSHSATIHDGVKVWYYSQDFDALDPEMIVWDSLQEMSNSVTDQEIFRTAAQFLLTSDLLKNTIWSLSEWQKWLLCYARFVIQKPHVLILDEPTNHINFRHLPVIAESLNTYPWAMLVISHDQWFVDQLSRIETIDLWRYVS